MRYYIFKVNDSTGDEYYVLNNQYIGYIGFDSNAFRSRLEYYAKIKTKYQLFAKSAYTNSVELHRLNCDSIRMDEKEIIDLVNTFSEFSLSSDKTWYEIYYPNKNSSDCYLKEIDGEKTIKDLV